MTPAEELRAAAEKLRHAARRAEHESPSPWRLNGDVVRCADGGIVADASGEPDHDGDLPYIALMHPGLGAALADWLHDAAVNANVLTWPNQYIEQALVVARVILGSQP